jgi:putative flippase GtrA
VLNRTWTFKSKVSIWAGFPAYLAISTFTLGAHSTTQWFATEILGVVEVLSQFVGIAVTTVLNFVLVRTIVFRRPVPSVPPESEARKMTGPS